MENPHVAEAVREGQQDGASAEHARNGLPGQVRSSRARARPDARGGKAVWVFGAGGRTLAEKLVEENCAGSVRFLPGDGLAGGERASAGKVAAVLVSIPGRTFSRARRDDGIGPRPLRTNKFTLGRPGLSGTEARHVRRDNRELRHIQTLLEDCARDHVPCLAMGPEHSWAWSTPRWGSTWKTDNVQEMTLDQCCFGTPWRQRTRVIALNVQLPQGLARRCATVDGRCEMSGKKHLRLQGRDRDGGWYTLRATETPPRLARALAQAVTNACWNKKSGPTAGNQKN